MRIADKERVDCYREAYPHDQRNDETILQCIKRIRADKRYQKLMVNWATSFGGFSEGELKKGKAEEG